MAIYKKQIMWSEKDHSYNEPTPTFQRGVIAVRRRNGTATYIPTTIVNVIGVNLTPLDTKSRERFANYSISLTKQTLNAASVALKDVSSIHYARKAGEIIYSSAKLYEVLKDITTNTSGVVVASGVAQGLIRERKEYSGATTPNFVLITTSVAAATTTKSAELIRFAYEVIGYK